MSHRMIGWNFQRKQMRENMRVYAQKLDKQNEEIVGKVYLYEGNLVKVSQVNSTHPYPLIAVGEILDGEDKGKTTTIYLEKATLTKKENI